MGAGPAERPLAVRVFPQDATPTQYFSHRYNPHPNETFMPNLRHHVYESPIEDLCPRRLALFFMILAVGCLVDLSQPPDSPIAETYHHLARASLCEIPVMEDTTFDAIVALVCCLHDGRSFYSYELSSTWHGTFSCFRIRKRLPVTRGD
jgi:hypothetical protein